MDLGLADRVYVVTGASRGLGAASALALAAEGARLVLCSRDQARLDELATQIGGADRVIVIPGDLADADLPGRLCAAAIGRYGRLDGT